MIKAIEQIMSDKSYQWNLEEIDPRELLVGKYAAHNKREIQTKIFSVVALSRTSKNWISKRRNMSSRTKAYVISQ